MVRAQQPSGQFIFEHDFLLGGRRPDSEIGIHRLEYITREASAAYGLSNYFGVEQDPAVARALIAALRNFGRVSVPIAKGTGQSTLESTGILKIPFGRYKLHDTLQSLGLLYRPAGDGLLLSYDHSYETAWGGATALALLTELQFYRASRDSEFAALRRGWLQGLLVLYDSGRGFRALPDWIDENALSNGEIWLAFAVYMQLFPQDRAAALIVSRIDDYMMKTYSAQPLREFYSWGARAAAQRFDTTSDVRFSAFIARQTHAYLDRPDPSADSANNSCSQTEGLVSALHVLTAVARQDPNLITQLRQRIHQQMARNLSLQIQPGQTRIELGNGAYLSDPAIADFAGAFLAGTKQPYVRIDLTEHCLSALVDLGPPN